MTSIFSTLIFIVLLCYIFLGRCFYCLILGQKLFFCCRAVSISAQKCDRACSKQRGDLIEISQPVRGGVKIYSVGRAKGGYSVLLHQDRVQHALLYFHYCFYLLKSNVQELFHVHSVLNLE